jgi:hypothetical protein
MAITFTQMAQKVLLWIHGMRLGIAGDPQGDGQPATSTCLVLDGIPIGSTRGALLVAKVNALGAAGSVSLAGTPAASAAVGDAVVAVFDFGTAATVTDVTASYEATISVAGAIQQTAAGTAGHNLLVFIQPQS